MKIFITPLAPKMLPDLRCRNNLFSLTSLKSTQGRPFKVVPTKKCPGLRYARSLGLALNGKRGGELRIVSISFAFPQRSNEPCPRFKSCGILQILPLPPITSEVH